MLKLNLYNSVSYMVRPAEFESATPWFVARDAIEEIRGFQAILSYKIPQIPPNNHAGLNGFCRTFFHPETYLPE